MVLDRSLVRFHAGIKSESTHYVYDKILDLFLKFVKIKEASGLLQLKDAYLQEMVEDWIIHQRSIGLRLSTVRHRISALELFFAMNDRILNWKKIKKMTPPAQKTLGGIGYTTEEVKKILSLTTSLRNKALIHMLASTGCRVGALPDLRLRDLSDMHDCKAVIFYRDSTEEYISFMTPEARKALEEYLEKRQQDGEILTPETFVFRADYRWGGVRAKSMSYRGIRSALEEIIVKVRGKTRNRHIRHSKMLAHAFRKRFNTILKSNKNVNITIAERLMSHYNKTVPLDTVYFSASREVLFSEYKKAIPDLIIDDSERERLGRIEAEKKVSELVSEKDKTIAELEARLSNIEKLINKIN